MNELSYGVTFSPRQARDLGLDWQKTFIAALDDLGVKKLRLSAYWDIIEANKGNLDWSETDWLLAEANKRDVQIIMAVGGRLPRWPECHFPEWIKAADKASREQATLDYIGATVTRYKGEKKIIAWQVENEPFLSKFGECPKLDSDFLDREIALVKSLDDRPVVVTDSGELSDWVRAAKRGDIFGTTMYRDTFSKYLDRYVHYPISPSFFRVKRNLAKIFASPREWLVIELQGEPWSKESFQNVSQAERDITMSPENFDETLEFARLAGFREFYLWGVEWWYWEKTTQNRPIFWQKAKNLFNNSYVANY
jgi:endo-1,4-beta-mannosidase